MYLGNPDLETLQEYKLQYKARVRERKNKQERERAWAKGRKPRPFPKVIEKKKPPPKIIHRDWEKMECLIEYYPDIL
jgi:hypothetical protein